MTTERLYEKDAYCRFFEASVLSCEERNGAFEVILDRTAFFPEGGGQAADEGTLNGMAVCDVKQKGEAVVHTMRSPLPVGGTVKGEVDFALRFARMQSHAGEHILSGVVHALFGFDNVGFHMSEKTMTVDFNGVLTQADIEAVEAKANEAVWKNVPITVSYPTEEEAAAIDYRSKIDYREGLRLVTIEGVDCCACCAPHPSRSGEIGLIKILDVCPNKGGTRVEMAAGKNAFDDYAALNRMNKALMGLLSAKRDGVQAAVEKQNETAGALRSEAMKLSRRLAMSELVPTFVGRSFFACADGLSFDDLRHCANELTATHADCGICLLLSRDAEGQVLYVAASPKGDVRSVVGELNKTFGGKGGGKPAYAQGKLASAENEEALLAAVRELLEKEA